MKLYLKSCVLFFFLSTVCIAQSSFFEKSLEPDFDTELNAVTSDSLGNFYAVGRGSPGILRPGWFLKTDINGNILLQIPLRERDESYLNHIIPSSDNFLVCGYNTYCDIGPANQGILYKLYSTGGIIWKKEINPDTSFYFLDNNLRQVIEMHNGRIILMADSTLYLLTGTGDPLWSREFPLTISDAKEDFNQQIIVAIQSDIFLLDTLGQTINQYSFPYPVYNLETLKDSSYLIVCGSYLMKLDSGLNMVNQFDISQINFSTHHLAVTDSSIWFTNQTGNEFAGFNYNLQIIDTFRTQEFEATANSITVYDTLIVIAGAEKSRRDYQFLKSFSTGGKHSQRPADLGILSIEFDTAWGYHDTLYPQGVNTIAFVARLTVMNTGSETINQFNINTHTQIAQSGCGPFERAWEFVNVNLQPGQSMALSLDTLSETDSFSLPFTYTFCAWTSCPNEVLDKNHFNDYLCDSFVITKIVGIESYELEKGIAIYPNPSDFFQINSIHQINSLELLDVQGRILFNKTLNENMSSLDLSGFQEGVYFLILNLEKGIVVKKIMVRHY